MTQMSDSPSRSTAACRRNPLQLHGRSPLARAVHVARPSVAVLLTLLLLTMIAGCVIPPSLRPEDDAGLSNSPPAIRAVTSDQVELAEPGPVSIERGEMAGSLSVSALDSDLADTLYIRIFIDYNMPERLPARVACFVAPNGNAMRSATCNMSGLCTTADIGVRRNMTIMVFDRPPLDFGTDPQAMMGEGGLSTSRFYFVQCQLPQTP